MPPNGGLAEFPSAVEAVRAAMQFQARIKKLAIGDVEDRQDNYGHHHPDFMHGAANAITSKSRQVSVIETVVDLESAREKRQKPNDILVGVAGFEPATPASRIRRASCCPLNFQSFSQAFLIDLPLSFTVILGPFLGREVGMVGIARRSPTV
jgi:hypothetical protein